MPRGMRQGKEATGKAEKGSRSSQMGHKREQRFIAEGELEGEQGLSPMR